MKLLRKSLLACIVFFICSQVHSQQRYFQQEVNYKIKVRLDDKKHELSAHISMEYSNNSPDVLHFIYFHLWPNAYKNNNTDWARQMLAKGETKFYYSPDSIKGFIDSLDFHVDGEPVKWEYDPVHIDICKIVLNEPLQQGASIVISTPFHVKIPGDFSRLGHEGQSYQITQWYPKPAVYDREGWHQFPYLNQGEFYSEFGSFDMEITLPKNYVVGATGELQNEDEKEWLTQKAFETAKIERFDSTDLEHPLSAHELKTLRYKEKNIHDFAWFADKRYHVIKDSVQLPNSGRWVTTWAMFTNKRAAYWKKATSYINDAITYYSKWYGDYPYHNCTAVKGALSAGGAMEYPTITVVSSDYNELIFETAVMHEVGHNWFYGVLGFNERRYPYLDEGINTFSEMRYMNTKYGDKAKVYKMVMNDQAAIIFNIDEIPYSYFYEIGAVLPQRFNMDQPMNLHSEEYVKVNYGSIVYHKSALSFHYLLNYLGEEKFNEIMQGFFEEWKYKHPQPDDVRAAFENSTTKDLSWFFDELLPTTKKIDYKAVRLKNNNVLIRNKGDISAPVSISGLQNGKVKYMLWDTGFTKSKWIGLPEEQIDKLVVNNHDMSEYNRNNNILKTSGVFKKIEPLEVHPFQILEKSSKTQLGVLPAMGWNKYNQYMLGALFYSPYLPLQRFDYQLIPMFAFGNNNLAGTGEVILHTHLFSTFFERIDFGLSGLQYAYASDQETNFRKYKTRLDFLVRKQNPYHSLLHKVSISYTGASDIYDSIDVTNREMKYFFNAVYSASNNRAIHPYNFSVNYEISEYSNRILGELNYTFSARYSEKAMRFRIFTGYIVDENINDLHSLYVSGTPGYLDYQYSGVFLGRFEYFGAKGYSPFLSQQFIENEGGFAAFSPLASNKWLVSLNGKAKIPKAPVDIYFNIAAYEGAGDKTIAMNEEEKIKTEILPYDVGVDIDLGGILTVYFPVLISNDIDRYLDEYTNNYFQRIRFSLNLHKLNIFKLRDEIRYN